MKPFVYKAKVVKIVDGDTIDLDCDLGFGIWYNNQRVRLLDVDTPETRTTDLREKQFGLLAKQIVENLCPIGSIVIVETKLDKDDKFGRILGTIWVDDSQNIGQQINVNQFLIDNHYAVVYFGQNKDDIAAAHEENYKFLTENGKV